MSVAKLREEIDNLKKLTICKHEPTLKIFVFRADGLTEAGENEVDAAVYASAHPHTRVLKLFRRSFRKL